jgi:hypothetical protein
MPEPGKRTPGVGAPRTVMGDRTKSRFSRSGKRPGTEEQSLILIAYKINYY